MSLHARATRPFRGKEHLSRVSRSAPRQHATANVLPASLGLLAIRLLDWPQRLEGEASSTWPQPTVARSGSPAYSEDLRLSSRCSSSHLGIACLTTVHHPPVRPWDDAWRPCAASVIQGVLVSSSPCRTR